MKNLWIVILLNVVIGYAYLPRLVFDQEFSLGNPIKIKKPEVAQAFYGELRNRTDYYKIIAGEDFDLYVNILAPDILAGRTDFSVEVFGTGKAITLNGELYEWEKYREKSTDDSYWKGPAYEESLEKGEYLIQVYNLDNQGKYVLVVGEKETFSPKELINFILSMPKLKGYFEKAPMTAYFNQIGLFLFITLFIIGVLIAFIVFLIRRLTAPKFRPL